MEDTYNIKVLRRFFAPHIVTPSGLDTHGVNFRYLCDDARPQRSRIVTKFMAQRNDVQWMLFSAEKAGLQLTEVHVGYPRTERYGVIHKVRTHAGGGGGSRPIRTHCLHGGGGGGGQSCCVRTHFFFEYSANVFIFD